ncbi:MAG: cytochrome B [Sphingomonas sp. SCN 67-18]|uniref:cytochrome b n=1 Tax=uncultured Sphingomonas sp. TaxID=158754 RepID=UPI00086A9FF0|nr:cytochrome b [Sphingomonas sp. SCN 67-18]ODU20018.1 MAG: cytochrome B [Sphingomonas sp. SCN 67-18]
MGRRYSSVAIALHWLVALLLIANLAIGIGHDWLKDSLAINAMPLHKSFGISILALSLLRLGWRLAHRPPPLPAGMSALTRRIAHATHMAFYGIMIAMPLSGWVFVSAGRYPLSWFGLVDLPKFAVEKGSGAVLFSRAAHELLGWMTVALVAAHVAAALYHHLLRRDDVLAAMLPRLRARRA